MSISLPPLPYAEDALAPHISAETLSFHYGKHHQAYVNKTNDAIKGTPLDDASIEEIVVQAKKDGNHGLYNNSAQVWNHTFYWDGMKPGAGGKPTGAIAEAIEKDFGSYEEFKDKFAAAGANQFGSGWAWLIAKGGKLEITNSPNAVNYLDDSSVTHLLTMDVWEHAYYLDYQNARPKYIDTFLDELVNWDFVNENLAKA
ncbi:superoxide dismutase [Aquisalinus flavus]|uniref:Superoxide dismutase n=1 Tax=Aquisalinus flavus TaxID=1526572 RepID=A0A8J2V6V2_9PROT|nr:superoxide dismutase [Aquisalinus flavus]MBD0426199.1 superoxide dismutase [Aquisalinus flavus]UNE48227.1 superoxide dismutase [Aquisalinus flavus]GGD09799.1 superoxide dismutase [Aquisalinus flavus]